MREYSDKFKNFIRNAYGKSGEDTDFLTDILPKTSSDPNNFSVEYGPDTYISPYGNDRINSFMANDLNEITKRYNSIPEYDYDASYKEQTHSNPMTYVSFYINQTLDRVSSILDNFGWTIYEAVRYDLENRHGIGIKPYVHHSFSDEYRSFKIAPGTTDIGSILTDLEYCIKRLQDAPLDYIDLRKTILSDIACVMINLVPYAFNSFIVPTLQTEILNTYTDSIFYSKQNTGSNYIYYTNMLTSEYKTVSDYLSMVISSYQSSLRYALLNVFIDFAKNSDIVSPNPLSYVDPTRHMPKLNDNQEFTKDDKDDLIDGIVRFD